MWSLRNIYLYLVCFVTLMMMIIGTVNVIKNITDILYPDEYLNYSPYSSKLESQEDLTTEEKERIAQEEMENRKKVDSIRNKKQLVKSLALFIVALPVFIYHWRKIEYEKIVNKST